MDQEQAAVQQEQTNELQQEAADQTAQQDTAEQTTQQDTAEQTAQQDTADQTAQQDTAEQTAQQEAAGQTEQTDTAAQDTQSAAVEELSNTTGQEQNLQTVVVQETATPGSDTGKQGEEGGFPFLIAAIVLVVVLLIAAVAALLLLSRKKKKSRRNDWDDMWTRDGGHTVEEEPMLAANTGVAAPEEDDTSVTENTPRTEPPTEMEMLKTEMVQTAANHPHFIIGRGATIGGREEQQDSFYCSNWTDDAVLNQRGLLVAVADGIGGLNDGALASSAAMSAMQSCFARNAFNTAGSAKLLSLSAAAHAEVLRLNQSGHRCGCTLVTVLIEGWNMYLASVGDSRIYLYRAGGLIALNREHTLGRENDDLGTMARESVSSENLKRPKAITSYLGKTNIRLIDRTIHPMKLLPGDKIALMSDGVFGTLSEDAMIEALRKQPETAVKEMISSIDARKDPRQDNATVVVIAVQ